MADSPSNSTDGSIHARHAARMAHKASWSTPPLLPPEDIERDGDTFAWLEIRRGRATSRLTLRRFAQSSRAARVS